MVLYLDQIYGFIRIIQKLREIDSFKEWLFEHHKIENNSEFFDGYLFLIIVCLRNLFESISIDDSLDLEEDIVYNRAAFVGKFINDLPNSSQKIIFLKNIYHIIKKINKSKSWNELNQNLDYVHQKIFSKYEFLLENYISINKRLSSYQLDEILDNLAIFYSYIFLIDTSHGKPKGYFSNFLKDKLSPIYLINTFKGYLFGLQFLFNSLLGLEFEKTSLTKLHLCFKSKKFKEQSKKNKAQYAHRLWLCIDGYFESVQREIIEPLETNINFKLGSFPSKPVFKPITSFDKTLFKLLITEVPSEPDYLNRSDQKSINKQIRLNLFWYPFKVLSGEYPIFTGVYSFVIVLNGSITLKSNYNSEEKLEIIRFIHPIDDERNNYSYAILIDVIGIPGLINHSGWLIFYNCCNDFSGFGGKLHYQAEKSISLYLKKDYLNVREFVINLDPFDKFLDKNKEKSYKSIAKQEELDLSIADVKGKFFESIISYYLLKQGLNVEWSPKINGAQIDIVAYNDNILHFYECKVSLGQNYLEVARHLLNKVNQLIEKGNFMFNQMKTNVIKNFKVVLVIWNKLDLKRKKDIKKQLDIEVYDDFKRIFLTDRIFTQMAEKKTINRIFNNFSDRQIPKFAFKGKKI